MSYVLGFAVSGAATTVAAAKIKPSANHSMP
jgi:hypothetical protein